MSYDEDTLIEQSTIGLNPGVDALLIDEVIAELTRDRSVLSDFATGPVFGCPYGSVGTPAHDNNHFISWFFIGLFFDIWVFVGRSAHATGVCSDSS